MPEPEESRKWISAIAKLLDSSEEGSCLIENEQLAKAFPMPTAESFHAPVLCSNAMREWANKYGWNVEFDYIGWDKSKTSSPSVQFRRRPNIQ